MAKNLKGSESKKSLFTMSRFELTIQEIVESFRVLFNFTM